MDSEGASHEHVLWSLDDLALGLEEIAPLEGLEAEEVVVEVSRVIQLGIDLVSVLLYHSLELGVDHACISALLVYHLIQFLDHLKVIVLCLFV